MLLFPMILVICVFSATCEVVRPMGDMDFKVISLKHEIYETTLDHLYYTLVFTGPPDTQVLPMKRDTTIRSMSVNGNWYKIKVRVPRKGWLVGIDIKSKSVGAIMRVVIDRDAKQQYQDNFPLNSYRYGIDSKDWEEITQYSARIQRPEDSKYDDIAMDFKVSLYSKEGVFIEKGYEKYFNTTGSNEEKNGYLYTFAMIEDGVYIEELNFTLFYFPNSLTWLHGIFQIIPID